MSTHIQTEYWDGLGNHVIVSDETLARVTEALQQVQVGTVLPPVVVAWEGAVPAIPIGREGDGHGELILESGEVRPLVLDGRTLRLHERVPLGYHQVTWRDGGGTTTATLISAPIEAYRRPQATPSWGVGTHLAALRSYRSRSLADLRDLDLLCGWVAAHGGDLVTVLPLLPTFNDHPAEPSPYSAVSRLHWSELILDLGDRHRPVGEVGRLDVTRAAEEVREALAGVPIEASIFEDPWPIDYAAFRAAQQRYGRNWRDWPEHARRGELTQADYDADEFRFHVVAQQQARTQLHNLRARLEAQEMRLGLDLAVGVHPDSYDTWSRQHLFVESMSVGAPPDFGFPSGQDWGFRPVHPVASRMEGHAYLRDAIAHQMSVAGVLRVDHIMAWSRLYWIPEGMRLDQGTYVSYPADELFAILTLESHRHRCEVVGENLGTVPEEIFEALPRHRIWGMYLAQFAGSGSEPIVPPTKKDVALIGTHDTPTFAGWLAGDDVTDRVAHELLDPDAEATVRAERAALVGRLAAHLGAPADDPPALLRALLEWLGRSPSPLVIPWFEDLWCESAGVNLPGTSTAMRANWQRPMARLLDDVLVDRDVSAALSVLDAARREGPLPT
jgi:4-alpha-glucanotransferase